MERITIPFLRKVPSVDPELLRQEKALPTVLGGLYDENNPLESIQVSDGNLIQDGKVIPLSTIDTRLAPKKDAFLYTSERVIHKAHQVCPTLHKVFAPFNGGETTGLAAEHTVATDKLPIGSEKQVDALYNNQCARAVYLADKLDRGHSYSGVTHTLGYIGAMLRWDIEAIQGSVVQDIAYLDPQGNKLTDPTHPAAGIKISYTTPDDKVRVHEQYTCSGPSLPEPVKSHMGTFDGLYLRGTESLVTTKEFYPEYQSYVDGVKPGGVIVADTPIETLEYRMEDVFSGREIVRLGRSEQFGYAGKKAKINALGKNVAFQGHVNILTKGKSTK